MCSQAPTNRRVKGWCHQPILCTSNVIIKPLWVSATSECTPVCVWTCFTLVPLFVEPVCHETASSSRADLCWHVIARWVTSKRVLSAFTCRSRHFSCYCFKRLVCNSVAMTTVCFHTFPVLKDQSSLNSALVLLNLRSAREMSRILCQGVSCLPGSYSGHTCVSGNLQVGTKSWQCQKPKSERGERRQKPQTHTFMFTSTLCLLLTISSSHHCL